MNRTILIGLILALLVVLTTSAICTFLIFQHEEPYNPLKATNSTPVATNFHEPVQYVAIVDAALSCSRIVVYRFQRNETNELELLNDDFIEQFEPGLNSYLDDVEGGVRSIAKLLERAHEFIPENRLASTRLALRATAGMRMADKDKADHLMNEIRSLFAKSKFDVDEKSVQIMEGSDESIFSWIAVRYLLGSLNLNQDPEYDVQFDNIYIGEDSTVITFPLDNDKEISQYKQSVRNLTVAGKSISVITHSYRDTGLEVARHAILTNGSSIKDTTLQSPCISPHTLNASWSYQNVEYHVSGQQYERPVTDFEACKQLIKMEPLEPRPLFKKHTLAWDKLISVTFNLGKRGEFFKGSLDNAVKECNNNMDPFHCLDLIYTSTLVTNNLDLPMGRFKFYINISDHFVSWTLGCALNELGYVNIER